MLLCLPAFLNPMRSKGLVGVLPSVPSLRRNCNENPILQREDIPINLGKNLVDPIEDSGIQCCFVVSGVCLFVSDGTNSSIHVEELRSGSFWVCNLRRGTSPRGVGSPCLLRITSLRSLVYVVVRSSAIACTFFPFLCFVDAPLYAATDFFNAPVSLLSAIVMLIYQLIMLF